VSGPVWHRTRFRSSLSNILSPICWTGRGGTDDWSRTGLDASGIESAIGFGLTVDEVRDWAPLHPLEISWAKKHKLSLAEARRWAEEGVPVRDAVQARAVGLTIEELHRWEDEGFNVADAWEARETGVTMPEAIAWRDAGFVIPDALQLVRDHWTLDAARVARDVGLRRYGRNTE